MALSPTSSRGTSTASTYTLVSSVTNNSTAAFDVSSLPVTYTDLFIVCMFRTGAAGASENVNLTLNNDSGGNYYWQRFESRGTSNAGAEGLGSTAIRVGEGVGNGGTAGRFSCAYITIFGYAAATWHKNVICQVFAPESTTTQTEDLTLSGGAWASTSAVTRVTITGTSNGFVSGSTMRIYGVT